MANLESFAFDKMRHHPGKFVNFGYATEGSYRRDGDTDYYTIHHHSTIIVQIIHHPDFDSVYLNAGGWRSKGTAERINHFIGPLGLKLSSTKIKGRSVWIVNGWRFGDGMILRKSDDWRIDKPGNVQPDDAAMIDSFVKRVKAGNLTPHELAIVDAIRKTRYPHLAEARLTMSSEIAVSGWSRAVTEHRPKYESIIADLNALVRAKR